MSAREATLRDLGGLMLEMYKRNRFREELLLDKCEEVLAIEVEIAHVDQRLFQLAPATATGQRPIGRCECSAPILPGQNFCAVCGRAFATLTQSRTCTKCGSGLRTADAYCSTCGTASPDLFGSPDMSVAPINASTLASKAADTMVIDAVVSDATPPLTETATPGTAGERISVPPGTSVGTDAHSADDAAKSEGPAHQTPDLNFPIRTEPATPPPASAADAAMDIAIAVAQAQPVSSSDSQLDSRTRMRISREKKRQIKQMEKAKARAKAKKERARENARRRSHGDGSP